MRLNTIPVEEKDRFDFLPKYLGVQHMMAFEIMIYAFAGELIEGYEGGYWEFYEIDRGMFMAPKEDGLLTVRSPNGSAYALPAIEAGIVVCLFAFSNFAFYLYERHENTDNMAIYSYALKDYMSDSKYASQIFRLID